MFILRREYNYMTFCAFNFWNGDQNEPETIPEYLFCETRQEKEVFPVFNLYTSRFGGDSPP